MTTAHMTAFDMFQPMTGAEWAGLNLWVWILLAGVLIGIAAKAINR